MHSRQKQPRQRHFTKQITTPVEIIDIDRGMKVSKGGIKKSFYSEEKQGTGKNI